MKENNQQQQKNKKNNNLLRTIFIYACSILIVGGVVCGIVYAKNSLQAKETNEASAQTDNATTEQAKVTEEVYVPEIEVDIAKEEDLQEVKAGMTKEEMETLLQEAAGEAPAEGTEEAGEVTNTINFETLQEANPDVYAWIEVPGTKIAYPILQHPTDNTHYLNYNLDGTYGLPGCIYTENYNTKTFNDPNTVIYGHNMKNGSMFAGLHKFEDSGFFADHKDVYIYTPDKTLHYIIFAAYVYDDRHLMLSYNFKDEAVYERYLNDILSKRDISANIRSDVEVTKEDRIITLATCMSKQPEKRLLVHAVLQQ